MAVVMISDVPNQYVTFGDVDEPLREDDAVAHTWAHSLRGAAPELPLHVPMATAASRGMDLAEQELGKQGLTVDRFIITGASKRGWSAWFTALADERVMAIVPSVIDVADTSICWPDCASVMGGALALGAGFLPAGWCAATAGHPGIRAADGDDGPDAVPERGGAAPGHSQVPGISQW